MRVDRLAVRGALAAALLAAVPAHAEDAAPVVLCDFDKGDASDGWQIRSLDVAEVETPQGRGLKLSGNSAERSNPVGWMVRPCDVRDWRTFRAFAIRVRVDAKAPVAMRVQAVRTGSGGRLLRRFTVEPGDWRDVVLELKDFRDDTFDQAGSFAQVGSVLLRWDEGAGDVTIDDLRLLPGDRGPLSCRMTPEDVQRLAFPQGKSRRLESEHFLLVDNVPAIGDPDAHRLLARLEEGLTVLGDRYGLTGDLGEKVPLVLFATRPEYEAFATRLGEHFGATVSPPKSDGFSVFGMGLGWFDEKQGWDRPVFVHEALHGAIHRLLGVVSNGNWIQEGLASAVQTRLHPDSLDRRKLADSFAKRGGWLVPWSECLAEQRPGIPRYPQLLSMMDFLAETHRAALPKVWDAVRALREPLHKSAPAAIAKALGTDAAKLEEEWFAWGAEHYGGK